MADPRADFVLEAVVLGHGVTLEVERPRDPEALIDEQAFDEADEFLPYWAELWPSGLALARALAPRALRAKRTVELGCGLGLPSLAAAHAGARVTATDWADDALALLQANASRNDLALITRRVDWRAARELVEDGPWDLVLAADVLYEQRAHAPLLELLLALGCETLLADPGRAVAQAFWPAAEDAGLEVTEVAPLVRRLRPARPA